MAEPADMIVPLLREMRAENLTQHEQTRALITALDKRLGGMVLESKVKELEGQK